MSKLAEALEAVLAVLDKMELRYAIGGSLASSAHGLTRSTMDVDIVVAISAEDVQEFARLVRDAFYIDEDEVFASIRMGKSFHLIHLPTVYKVDIFPAGNDAFRAAELQRRVFVPV